MTSIFDSSEFNGNLFFPRPDLKPVPPTAMDLFVPASEQVKLHVRRYPDEGAQFILLYFHGNGEIASDYDDLAEVFASLNAELIVAEYRGYGKSDGRPTLRSALEDSHLIYQYLVQEGYLKRKCCVMGRSLGSAAAIELCSKHSEISACVVESGYADPIPLVERRGLRIDKTTDEENALFNNSYKIAGVHCPTLIMHGEDDFLISSQEAEENFRCVGTKEKTLEILEGVGHNDMMMAHEGAYFKALNNFFSTYL
ncbi:MAG: alpha/beta hydrolase [Nitrospinae bacterium CG11_big_fil_rev_8_21_14_0_20_45_15]|nr:MAG: alpha/beta hydrolase [Nitrospinae bacterium CG11_big_fil_rev_8_21_14_0_20_45_15]